MLPRHVVLLICAPWVGAGCALTDPQPVAAQRPTFSFSTATTAPGTYEIETGVLHDPGDFTDTPTTLKFGVDANKELFLRTSPVLHVDDGDHTGFGDVGFGGRWRFAEANVDHPAFAVQAAVKLPTANEDLGLGTGNPDLFLSAIMTAQVGTTGVWTTYCEAEVLGDDEGGSGVHLGQALGLVYGWALTDRVSPFAEVVTRAIPDQDVSQTFTTLGLQFTIEPAWVMDLSYVRGIGGDDLGPQFALGFTRNFGRLRRRRAPDAALTRRARS